MTAAIAPLVEEAALSLDDVPVLDEPGATKAKRWMRKFACQDSRHAARRADVLLAALRGGSGWKAMEVKTVADETAPLHQTRQAPEDGQDGDRGEALH